MSKAEDPSDKLPLRSTLSVILLSFGGFLAVGPVVGILVASVFYGFDFEKVMQLLSTIGSEDSFRLPLLLIQGIASLTGFVLIPYFFFRKRTESLIFSQELDLSKIVLWTLLVFFIILSFMGINAVVIDWNASIDFPSFMDGFEKWAKQSEKQAEVSTQFLINFSGWFEFLLGLIVIAIIPGVGEEIVFRGILQKQLNYHWKNPHLAIWISAILFSAFHFQFYGFVPRAFLGALFGYLYLWSGHLIVPVIGHVINNGFTLTMAFLHSRKLIEFDIQETEYEFSLIPFLASLSLFLVFILYFRRLMNIEKASHA
ncbi:MAG: CPBP family intramembrane glutamic endopeptidase [Bacteroidota bacterium]